MSVQTDRVIAGASVAQVLVVVFSLYFINSQLKAQNAQLQQQTDLTRAANAQALVSLALPGNMQEMEHPEVAKLWIKGRSGEVLKGDEVAQEQYAALVSAYLTFHENIHIQREKNLLDDEIYQAWDNDLENFVKEQHMEQYWAENKWLYQSRFSAHVDELIKKKPSTHTP